MAIITDSTTPTSPSAALIFFGPWNLKIDGDLIQFSLYIDQERATTHYIEQDRPIVGYIDQEKVSTHYITQNKVIDKEL